MMNYTPFSAFCSKAPKLLCLFVCRLSYCCATAQNVTVLPANATVPEHWVPCCFNLPNDSQH